MRVKARFVRLRRLSLVGRPAGRDYVPRSLKLMLIFGVMLFYADEDQGIVRAREGCSMLGLRRCTETVCLLFMPMLLCQNLRRRSEERLP